MANYQVYFRLDNGPWFPTGSDPVANTGGVNISGMEGTPMFPAVQGTGDVTMLCNFGASPFANPSPSGYFPGWPHSGGGFTTLDPGKLFGSASLISADLGSTFISIPGLAQATDGYSTGQYYFEIEITNGDIFSADWGGGIGANYADGGDFTFWFDGPGAFTGTNNLGGALLTGQSLSHEFSSLAALGAIVQGDVFSFPTSHVVGIAVFLTFVPPANPVTLAELWFGQTSGFVDLTSESARRAFISLTGGAVDLGLTGQNPFGVSPPVYLSRRGVPATFADNNGRGGGFVVSGDALTAGATNPPGTESQTIAITPYSPGQGVLGDYRNGNLYAFNTKTLTDNGTQRRWLRRWRALPQTTIEAVSFKFLNISAQSGAVGTPDGTQPQAVLRWSDDGGHSWSDERIIPVGPLGRTRFTIKFNRLGGTRRFSGSDRVFELSSTDPFVVSILDAEVDVT